MVSSQDFKDLSYDFDDASRIVAILPLKITFVIVSIALILFCRRVVLNRCVVAQN